MAHAWMLAALSACGPGGAMDAGERPDIVLGDAVPYDRPRPMETGPGDVTDIATQVDVRPFDGGMDTGATADGASPADAAMDSGTNGCRVLADEYARAVIAAQACSAGTDCATIVCETLCCQCQVFVNPNASAYPMLARLSSQWQALQCNTSGLCMQTVACDPPASAACSSRSRCATVRAPSGG